MQPGGGHAPRPPPGHLPPGLLSPSAWSRVPEPRPGRAVAHSGHPRAPGVPCCGTSPQPRAPGPTRPPRAPASAETPQPPPLVLRLPERTVQASGRPSAAAPGTQTPEDRGCGGSRRVAFWELGLKPEPPCSPSSREPATTRGPAARPAARQAPRRSPSTSAGGCSPESSGDLDLAGGLPHLGLQRGKPREAVLIHHRCHHLEWREEA